MKIFMLFFLMQSAYAYNVGDKVENFTLIGHDGKKHALSDHKDKYVVLEWYNDGCPYVRKHYDSKNMQQLQKKFATNEKVVWLAINSSAKGKQGHLADPSAAAKMVEKEGMMAHKLLLDPDGKIGRKFAAKTTPHMFIISPEGKIVYNGAIDSDSGFDAKALAKAENYVDKALTSLLAGKTTFRKKTEPYGCSVKY